MTDTDAYDALVIGGGPAGLSAALNLGRSLMRVLLVDADRPRNAATLNSHGFLTRDGVPPHELRRIAREELTAYPNIEVRTRVRVLSLERSDGTADAGAARFTASVGRTQPAQVVTARSVVLATGLRETLPEAPNLRGFYGISLFSCAACDAWEMRGRRLALIGTTDDLTDRARLISRWTDHLTVFTLGADTVTVAQEAELAAAGVAVARHPITELVGDRGRIEAIRLEDGSEVAIDGGFVRPQWETDLSFLRGFAPSVDHDGHLVTDRSGRTDIPGLYAAGDAAIPGPQQLIVAAGAGARVASVLVQDAVGITTAH
ncbi:NAD(P)/FAD-dependent oxidoreductase [Microbacterium foliorum]|uniref:NADH dehydrogenase n=1 Tax=Microbacterium foliorum TaxID=104336 RepID=A0A0F0L1U4_9MICO|nr:NAD(P)/FAD-dependent oxidoreductase [Microbacterium foliorum]AXL13422.1 NAD(P)/FAD-dependent oxidoreductase [Microbacterium foliorum]KJL25511.1 NADH dehydrogenase [Microbacterium foliorum]